MVSRTLGAGKEYFDIDLDELRSLGGWAAACAARSLPLFEAVEADDRRPRRAIEGVMAFAEGGTRSNGLRKLAMDAYRASREVEEPAAAAAARAASLAAASAFTHPFRDLGQAEHILGPAAYSALALELGRDGDPRVGDEEVRLAIGLANAGTLRLLREMPARGAGKKRIDALLLALDQGLRTRGEA